MMKKEFEAIAGYKVSTEDYEKIIEPMYSATDLSKEEFVKVIDRKRFEIVELTERQYINKIKKLAKATYEKLGHDTIFDEEREIIRLTREMNDKFGAEYVPIKEYELDGYRGCYYYNVIDVYAKRGAFIKTIVLV